MDNTNGRTDRSIWPLLTSNDALELRRWLAQLGFTEGVCVADADRVHHSEMLWPEGGRLMVCTADTNDPHLAVPGSARLYVVTAHPDQVHARALKLGAVITRGLQDTDYGSRGFSLATTEGHGISFGTYPG